MLNTNLFHETKVPFGDGLRMLKQGNGHGCSRHLLRRWSLKGVVNRFPDSNGCGNRITLEWMLVGGLRITSKEAYWRFIQRQNGEKVESPVNRKKPKG